MRPCFLAFFPMPHRLDPLLRPASIVVVGATRRRGAVGHAVLINLRRGKFPGPLYAVNPRYEEIEGVPCYPSLSALPQPVQHAIFALGDERLESALDEALAGGVKAATIFSALAPRRDSSPPLKQRVQQRAEQAQLLLCGGNSMGFYNFTHNVRACGFATRARHRPGGVALISQSGSGMSGILDVDERIDFNVAVSTGLELTVTAEDYLDYALDQAETRVVGLFLESSRRPERLAAGLRKAAQRGIPVVVVKTGRTELAARLAVSHSGALAGNDAAYDAVFDRYGAQRVEDMEQLATTLIMFAQPHPVRAGGLVAIHDSGGERQLLIDAAERLGTTLARISPATRRRLEKLLDPGLPAVNPLDVWSLGGADYEERAARCFTALLQDDNAALGAVVHDRGPGGVICPEYLRYLRAGHAAAGKPVFLVANRQGTGADPSVAATTRAGFPVLDGIGSFLAGAKRLLAYRDFRARPRMRPPRLPRTARAWRGERLMAAGAGEVAAGNFLRDCGIPMTPACNVNSMAELTALAPGLDYPVVMKTAMPGVRHKSDADGVRLSLGNRTQLAQAYRDLAGRLGNQVLIAPMAAAAGVEMLLGIAADEQFGPLVVMGMGGIYAELSGDVVSVVPPFDAAAARRCLARLRLRKLLDGVRGAPPVDVAAYCAAAARLSVLAVEFREQVQEVDVNPLKVFEKGCLGLDALVIMR